MKLIHLSDLHLGKRLNGFSLLDDQAHILDEILSVIDAEHPDAILIAGDIYDKPIPPSEASTLLDGFLVRLSRRSLPVFLISGNHDSPERLAFGGRLMEASGIHLSPVYNGAVDPLTLTDAYGPVNIYLLPFLKPAQVRRFFPEETIETYTDALNAAIRAMSIDPAVRNVLVTHQFVTGAFRCESEELSIGGSDNVDAAVFDPFDYVALGHLHNPQRVSRDTIRYCGTPLKYSFSEAKHVKSVTIVELEEKGRVTLRTAPLTPLRDMTELCGSYSDLTLLSFYENASWQNDYLHITLTDEDDIPGAASLLRVIYPNLMKLDYDNHRTRAAALEDPVSVEKKPLALLEEFYEQQNAQPMCEAQRAYARELMETIWEGPKSSQ